MKITKRYAVFIPCYNAASTILETLESVKGALSFAGLDMPVFIYDDCSKDDSRAVVAGFCATDNHFRLVGNEQNIGERKTTNAAFASFDGSYDWIFIIHADDVARKGWLTTLIEEIEKVDDQSCFTVWSSFDVLYDTGNTGLGDNSGQVQHVVKSQSVINFLITKISSSWHLSGAAVNVHAYRKVKGFDETMPQFGDTDFFVKGLLAGFTDVYISRTLTVYRISTSSVSGTSFRTNRDVREIYMLIDRYGHLLNKRETASMYKRVSAICARRTVKWGLKGKVSLAFANLKQFIVSTAQWAKTSIQPEKK